MRGRKLFAILFTAVMVASCSNNGVVKTGDSLTATVTSDSPVKKIRITVVDEKILSVQTSDTDDFSQPTLPEGLKSKGDATPYETFCNETLAKIHTRIEGVAVNRATTEIVFIDSIGKSLLSVLPGNITCNTMETALCGDGIFKLIFCQGDSLNYTAADSMAMTSMVPYIATDGYNILWRTNPDDSQEEFFLIYGEAVNQFIKQGKKEDEK